METRNGTHESESIMRIPSSRSETTAAPDARRTLLPQAEAALRLGVSVAYLRASDCPKVYLPGNGPKARPLVRYDWDAVMAWTERCTSRQASRAAG